MKYVKTEDMEKLSGRRLKPNDRFKFRCYPEIGCFNRCCRNLNLFLYPYDVIRLKNHLNMTSDLFLDKHVHVVLRPSNFFPEVLLKMSENAEKTCPFLEMSGCRIYPDRPDSCRTFPVEQGVFYDAEKNKTEPVYFFKPPGFCLGQHEETEWTVQTWSNDQDAVIYNEMTVRWSELKRLFQTDPWGAQGPGGPMAKMAFMATYNMDQFRDFLLKSTFLKRYKVASNVLKKIRSDDVELMKFGFEWVKFYVWGIKTKYIRLG